MQVFYKLCACAFVMSFIPFYAIQFRISNTDNFSKTVRVQVSGVNNSQDIKPGQTVTFNAPKAGKYWLEIKIEGLYDMGFRMKEVDIKQANELIPLKAAELQPIYDYFYAQKNPVETPLQRRQREGLERARVRESY